MPKNTLRFDSRASRPLNGLALIYDLEGFSGFFSQPDVQEYVPKFLNHVSGAISAIIFGGEGYWEKRRYSPLLPPAHEKFLGDGCLYIWTPQEDNPDFQPDFIRILCNRLWTLKIDFTKVLQRVADDVPVLEVPKKIRFGLARGTVYELKSTSGGGNEYIGFCINLASKLQHYCPELGFIASARVGLPQAVLRESGYTRVVATKLQGFSKEIVIVDSREFDALPPARSEELFASLE